MASTNGGPALLRTAKPTVARKADKVTLTANTTIGPREAATLAINIAIATSLRIVPLNKPVVTTGKLTMGTQQRAPTIIKAGDDAGTGRLQYSSAQRFRVPSRSIIPARVLFAVRANAQAATAQNIETLRKDTPSIGRLTGVCDVSQSKPMSEIDAKTIS
jgi:hypothetical protein